MIETLDNIDRLERPASKAIIDDYVQRGEPFILRGLLDDSFLAPFCDRDVALRALGGGRTSGDGQPETTAAEYFTRAEVGRGSLNVVWPPALEAQLIDFARRSPIGLGEMVLTSWMGRTGCLQQFHCDMDCRHNFLVQTFGTKRVCLVSPNDTQRMRPGLDRQLLLSEVPFHRQTAGDKLALLRFWNARDCLLEPGETLYIPPLWWHAIEYLSDSLSLSWRVDNAPLLRELQSGWARLWTHEWPYWQGIVWRLSSEPALRASHGDRVRELLRRLEEPRSPEARRLLGELHDELCPGRYALPFDPFDFAFLETRTERPPPTKRGPWRADDVPRLRPYTRFALVIGAAAPHTLLVLDGARVVADIPVDDEDREPLAELLAALQRPGARASVAALAAELGWELEALAALLEQFSRESWIVC